MNNREIAKTIDHAVLKPIATDKDLIDGVKIAKTYGVASICVRPCDVVQAKELLGDSQVALCTVIGFPHGTTSSLTKISESLDALNSGAKELDVVWNIGKVKSKDYDYVKADLLPIISFARAKDALVKIIIESSLLTEEEVVMACEICNEIKPDWIKTSTGFAGGGATVETIQLIKKHIDPTIQIKASGGIRTRQDAEEYIKLGCTRLGLSGTATILENGTSEGY